MTPVTRAFGANVKRLRSERSWLQAELAEKAGVSAATIASAERGACGLRFENAVKIARALGASLDEMVSEGPGVTG